MVSLRFFTKSASLAICSQACLGSGPDDRKGSGAGRGAKSPHGLEKTQQDALSREREMGGRGSSLAYARARPRVVQRGRASPSGPGHARCLLGTCA